MRTAVMASGTGSILAAIIEAGIAVAVVVVDRHCPAESIAAEAGIPVEVVRREVFSASFDRAGYTDSVIAVLEGHEVELVVLAGFGTILGPNLIDRYANRVLNTHPALLPAFKGWHAVRDALAAGVDVTGCTVHIVTAEVDEGPVLSSEEVKIEAGDTEESLHERIKQVERVLYPNTIKHFIAELEGGTAR